MPILENKLADYIMPDVTWTGGITELKKISALCEAYYIPVSPHDAGGPINVVAGAQVMMTVPNFYKLETSRVEPQQVQRAHRHAARQFERQPQARRACPGLGIEMNRGLSRGQRDQARLTCNKTGPEPAHPWEE